MLSGQPDRDGQRAESEPRQNRFTGLKVVAVWFLLAGCLVVVALRTLPGGPGTGGSSGGVTGTAPATAGNGDRASDGAPSSGHPAGTAGEGTVRSDVPATVAGTASAMTGGTATQSGSQAGTVTGAASTEPPTPGEPESVAPAEPIPLFRTVDKAAKTEDALPKECNVATAPAAAAAGTGTDTPAAPVAAAAPYRQRSAEKRAVSARENGASKESEDAVEKGLRWLAKQQKVDGSWSDMGGRYTVGPTGLAVLAFLGAGYTHREGKYQETVGNAIAWLVASQVAASKKRPDAPRTPAERKQQKIPTLVTRIANPVLRRGMFNIETFYEQGIATMALCEAFGMTEDDTLAEPAQAALDCIVANIGSNGGYGYTGAGNDTHVTSFQVMALKSGKLAKLRVPPGVCKEILAYYDDALCGGHGTRYGVGSGSPTPARTAVGLFCRLFLDCSRKDPTVIKIAKHLKTKGPIDGNMFQNYYGSYAMFQMGGEYWKQWNAEFRDAMIKRQLPDGSWQMAYGLVISTCLGVMSLEVYYRFLPVNR